MPKLIKQSSVGTLLRRSLGVLGTPKQYTLTIPEVVSSLDKSYLVQNLLQQSFSKPGRPLQKFISTASGGRFKVGTQLSDLIKSNRGLVTALTEQLGIDPSNLKLQGVHRNGIGWRSINDLPVSQNKSHNFYIGDEAADVPYPEGLLYKGGALPLNRYVDVNSKDAGNNPLAITEGWVGVPTVFATTDPRYAQHYGNAVVGMNTMYANKLPDGSLELTGHLGNVSAPARQAAAEVRKLEENRRKLGLVEPEVLMKTVKNGESSPVMFLDVPIAGEYAARFAAPGVTKTPGILTRFKRTPAITRMLPSALNGRVLTPLNLLERLIVRHLPHSAKTRIHTILTKLMLKLGIPLE